jgi:hypothetical protein
VEPTTFSYAAIVLVAPVWKLMKLGSKRKQTVRVPEDQPAPLGGQDADPSQHESSEQR